MNIQDFSVTFDSYKRCFSARDIFHERQMCKESPYNCDKLSNLEKRNRIINWFKTNTPPCPNTHKCNNFYEN